MAKESIGGGSFYFRPGGTKEDANPTELGPTEFSQVNGFDDQGALIRMPGKRLVHQYNDRVIQIAGFGSAVIIQHGSTLLMYSDACAVSPVPEETNPPITTNFIVDFTSVGPVGTGIGPSMQSLNLYLVDPDNAFDTDPANLLKTWTYAELNPAEDGSLPNLDFGAFLPAFPCSVRFAVQFSPSDIRILVHTVVGTNPDVTSQGPWIDIGASALGATLTLGGID